MTQATAHPFSEPTVSLPSTAKTMGRCIATVAQYLIRKKLSHIPDLTAPEAVEWPKPLPPEQWVKRSPELERAIAEREMELAEALKAA